MGHEWSQIGIIRATSAFAAVMDRVRDTMTRDQSRDTGMAMVLLCIYFGLETSFSVGAAADAAALLLRGLR